MTRYIKFYFVLSQKQKTNPNPSPIGTRFGFVCCGGDKRDRTADLLNAIQALSQLSYTPKYSLVFTARFLTACLLYQSKTKMSTLF